MRAEKYDPRRHRADAFDCGVEALNECLRDQAGEAVRLGMAQIYVLCGPEEPDQIVGFYALCACSLRPKYAPLLAREKPNQSIPGFLLARLAADKRYAGRDLGGVTIGVILAGDCIGRAKRLSEDVGARLLVVDAKNQELAEKFYEKKCGFAAGNKAKKPLRLYVPLHEAEGTASRGS